MIRVLVPTHVQPQGNPNAGLRKSIYFLVLSSLLFFGLLPVASQACQTSSTAPDSKADSNQWSREISPGVSLLGTSDPWINLKSICVSPDGKLVAAVNSAGEVEVIQLQNHKVIATYPIVNDQLHRMTFSPDSGQLAFITLSRESDINRHGQEVTDPNLPLIYEWLHLTEDQFSKETKYPLPNGNQNSEFGFLQMIDRIMYSPSAQQILLTGGGRSKIFRIKDKEVTPCPQKDLFSQGFYVSDDLIYFTEEAVAWETEKNTLDNCPDFSKLSGCHIYAVQPASNWILAGIATQAFLFNSVDHKRVNLEDSGSLHTAVLASNLQRVVGFRTLSFRGCECVVWDAASGKQLHQSTIPDFWPINLGLIEHNQKLLIELYGDRVHRILAAEINSNMDQQMAERLALPTRTHSIQIGNQNQWAILNDGRTLVDLQTGQRNQHLPLATSNRSKKVTYLSCNQSDLCQLSDEGRSSLFAYARLNDISDVPKVTKHELVRKTGTLSHILKELVNNHEFEQVQNLTVAFDETQQQIIAVLYGNYSKICLVKYDVNEKKVIANKKFNKQIPERNERDQLASISGDVRFAAFATQDNWQIVSIADNKTIAEIPRQKENAIVLSNDGRFMITGYNSSTDSAWCSDVRITDVRTSKVIKEFDQPVLFAAAENQDRMAVVDRPGRVELWELSSGEMIQSIGDCQTEPTAIEISSDGKVIICGLSDTRLQRWNLEEMQAESKR